MKLTITFKTPDALDYALDGLGEEEREEAKVAARRYVRWGEIVRIELDTLTGAARVLEA